MQFEENDILIGTRKATHQRFHTRCAFEKRNTVEGKVIWIEKN